MMQRKDWSPELPCCYCRVLSARSGEAVNTQRYPSHLVVPKRQENDINDACYSICIRGEEPAV